ncbi:repeat-containing protein [Candidatus Magnetomorum sp. HK-1]|nr:repeat-containing protein [Candidatus Magnetomorum sp. HK-1]
MESLLKLNPKRQISNYMAKKAFIVGVNTLGLRYSKKDADLMYECLVKYDYEITIPIYTKSNILEQFDQFIDDADKIDTLIFYFSGHGYTPKGDLLLVIDEDLSKRKSTININNITEAYLHCKAQNKLIILDCCNAMNVTDDWKVEQCERYRILTSSERLDTSKELDNLKASFLTYSIYHALMRCAHQISDEEGLIRINSLSEWLETRARQHNAVNNAISVPIPNLLGNHKANIPLATVDSLHELLNKNKIKDIIPPESCLSRQMRSWFEALGYGFEKYHVQTKQYFEWIINIPVRRGYDRVLVRGLEGEAGMIDFKELCQHIKQYKTDEGWLVAVRRVSPSVRRSIQKIGDSRLFVYTFDELLDEHADFTGYLNWLKKEITKKEIHTKYVPLRCMKKEYDLKTGKRYISNYDNIDHYIDLWLDDPSKKHISILGEFGTGKTWFTLHYTWIAMQRYIDAKQKGIQRPRLPLVIPLRDYTKAVSVESLFSEFIFRKHEIPIPGYSVFEQLNRMGKLILIFDGFDEMADRIDRQKMINNFWELARVIKPGTKAILTCRTEHFPQAKEGRALLNAELKVATSDLTGEPPQFETLELKKFDDNQIYQVLSFYTNTENVMKIVNLNVLKNLTSRPVMIKLILDALTDIESGKPIDLARVYLYATRHQIEKINTKGSRSFTSTADKLYFLCELSWEMLSTDNMSLNYRLFPERLRTFFETYVQEQKDLDHWHYDMMGQTMLIRDDEGDYSPAHRSLLEFFVAYKFCAELGALPNDFIEPIKEQSYVDSTLPPIKYRWSSYFQREKDSQSNIIKISPLSEFVPEPIDILSKSIGMQPISDAVYKLIINFLEIKNLVHTPDTWLNRNSPQLVFNVLKIMYSIISKTATFEIRIESVDQLKNSGLPEIIIDLLKRIEGTRIKGLSNCNKFYSEQLYKQLEQVGEFKDEYDSIEKTIFLFISKIDNIKVSSIAKIILKVLDNAKDNFKDKDKNKDIELWKEITLICFDYLKLIPIELFEHKLNDYYFGNYFEWWQLEWLLFLGENNITTIEKKLFVIFDNMNEFMKARSIRYFGDIKSLLPYNKIVDSVTKKPSFLRTMSMYYLYKVNYDMFYSKLYEFSSNKTVNILHSDNSLNFRKVLKYCFNDQEYAPMSGGLSIINDSGSPNNAITILNDKKIHLLITDISKQEMSGIELIEQSRLKYNENDLHIIVYSASNIEEYRKEIIPLKASFKIAKHESLKSIFNCINLIFFTNYQNLEKNLKNAKPKESPFTFLV